MRDLRLLDESINITSAIQLCGYPSVIGSLWKVEDRYSADVAQDVYSWILEGDGGFDARRAAEALHRAVHRLRDSTRFSKFHDPLSWTPFVHVGI